MAAQLMATNGPLPEGAEGHRVVLSPGQRVEVNFGSRDRGQVEVLLRMPVEVQQATFALVPGDLGPELPSDIPDGAQLRLVPVEGRQARWTFKGLSPGIYTALTECPTQEGTYHARARIELGPGQVRAVTLEATRDP